MDSGIDTFCLDATSFEHRGQRYYLWAQKGPDIPGHSNLYIAPMIPHQYSRKPVYLTVQEFEWEKIGFALNEGPAVIARHGRIFISYSASATNHNYCMGLPYADENADLLDPASWIKSPQPAFQSGYERGVYGPGHNRFTVSEDGKQDILVYHARTYTEIEGDPLWDPNRHTYIKAFSWSKDGLLVFGSLAKP